MPGDALAKAAGEVGSGIDPELADKVAKLKQKQVDEQAHELTEIEQLKIENLSLKMESLHIRQAAIEKERADLYRSIKQRLDLPEGVALIVDPEKMTVRKQPKE